MRKLVFLLLILGLGLPFLLEAKVITTAPEGGNPVGSIINFTGDAFRITSEGKKKRITSPGPLFEGEALKTKKDAALEIQFLDGSILNLGPRSHAILEEYRYDDNMDFGKMTVRIASGVYRFAKGKMRNRQPEDIRFQLPSGIIGIQDATVLAQVSDHRSLAILWESPGEPIVRHQIVVRNKVGNQEYETTVSQLGFGSVIKDKELAPTPAAKVLESDIAWILSQFNPEPPEEQKAAAEEEPAFALQAIVYDKEAEIGGKFVVVDGQLYEEGAMVHDHEILSIERDSVKIRDLATSEIKTIKMDLASVKEIEKTKEEVHVVSIFYDAQNAKHSFAYVNGILSREGDQGPNFRVLEIKPYSITLQKTGASEPEVVALEKTQSPVQQQELVPLFLQSIAYDPNPKKSFATINGKSYRTGEWVEGYPLVQISPEAVWVKRTPEAKPEKIPLEKGQEESGDERPKIELQLILYNQTQPAQSQVAIGSTLYKAGDLVEGYEILEVHKTFIRVRKKIRLPWRSYIIWELK